MYPITQSLGSPDQVLWVTDLRKLEAWQRIIEPSSSSFK